MKEWHYWALKSDIMIVLGLVAKNPVCIVAFFIFAILFLICSWQVHKEEQKKVQNATR